MTDLAAAPDARLRRIRYRAWHRGFRESDLILGPFADAHAEALDAGQLDRFEALLEQPDQDLYDWIVGRTPPPAAVDDDVFALIRAFRHSAHASRPVGDGA
jgi:antitoxin CptB